MFRRWVNTFAESERPDLLRDVVRFLKLRLAQIQWFQQNWTIIEKIVREM
jgi:hypothetical protein